MDNLTTTVSYDHDHDHDHEHSTDGVLVAKIVAMCVLFSLSFIVGTSPLYLSKLFNWNLNFKNNKVVMRLLCFGGGVLLCTTFLHLLPEISETINSLQSTGAFPSPESIHIHFAEFLMCCGFFILYFVEESIHWYLHSKEKDHVTSTLTRTFSIRSKGEKSPDKSTECIVDLHNHVDHSHVHFDSDLLKSFRGFFIVLALSVHELFEGLAVGLESSTSSVWYMFGAISAHKIIIAFCIGVELITNEITRVMTVIYIFTFSSVSAIGIAIGMVLSKSQEESTQVVSVILQGLASGTLLYIIFFEILRTDRKGGLKTFLSVFVGFAIMFAITAFIPHDHDHSH